MMKKKVKTSTKLVVIHGEIELQAAFLQNFMAGMNQLHPILDQVIILHATLFQISWGNNWVIFLECGIKADAKTTRPYFLKPTSRACLKR